MTGEPALPAFLAPENPLRKSSSDCGMAAIFSGGFPCTSATLHLSAGTLDAGRTSKLTDQMLAAGIPL